MPKSSKKILTERDRKMIGQHCGTTEGFQSYGCLYFKGLKLSTWSHDHQDSITKKCNCYIFSKGQQEFGQVERLIVNDQCRVFICYRVINGQSGEARYMKKNCTISPTMKTVEWVEDCIVPCIRVKVRSRFGFYIMKRVNRSYSS